MKREYILKLLAERHRENKERIRRLKRGVNIEDKPVKASKVLLSVSRKEQLIVDLVMELSANCGSDIKLSERAKNGLFRLIRPAVFEKGA
jgi:hypothetical protein